jgi:AcrR family transcriptional regulator
MTDDEARERLLAAAGQLFYTRGVHAVAMDEIREAAGLPLKRIYQYFPSKDRLVEAYLARRDDLWMAALARCVDQGSDPRQRVLAVFAFLGKWFATPGFHGCAFINAFGELGSSSGAVQITRRHKQRLLHYLAGLAVEAGAASPRSLAAQLLMLMDGAIVSAATGANRHAAADARAAAQTLLTTATRAGT